MTGVRTRPAAGAAAPLMRWVSPTSRATPRRGAMTFIKRIIQGWLLAKLIGFIRRKAA